MDSQGVIQADIPRVRLPRGLASVWTTPRVEVLAATSILLGAIGQLVVKGALLLLARNHLEASLVLRTVQPAAGVLVGLSIYAVGTWFWLKAVSRASISYLYPLSAASYALVALGGQFVFGENIQIGRWIGIGVICLGVAMLAGSSVKGSK